MNDAAWVGDEFIPYGGKLLVRVVCPTAGKIIGEVRTDPERGPLLWYRINTLRTHLVFGEKAERGRLPALEEGRSVTRLAEDVALLDAGHSITIGLGCPRCGSHNPDLRALARAAEDAARAASPAKFLV